MSDDWRADYAAAYEMANGKAALAVYKWSPGWYCVARSAPSSSRPTLYRKHQIIEMTERLLARKPKADDSTEAKGTRP